MSTEGFQFLFQLVSAVGVIASVSYLGYQMRQNTLTMRRVAEREIAHNLNGLGRLFVEQPDVAAIYLRALERPSEWDEVARFRFRALLRYVFSNLNLACEDMEAGLVSEEVLETYIQGVMHLFESRLVSDWWVREGQHLFGEALRARVGDRQRG